MNACGHHHVGHIGILGVEKNGQEFYQLTLGGSSDQDASLGDRLGRGISAAEVPVAIERDRGALPALRLADERFLDTYRRVGIEPFKEAVYGEAATSAAGGGLMGLIREGRLVPDPFIDASGARGRCRPPAR